MKITRKSPLEFTAKFKGMRKEQGFIVYPVNKIYAPIFVTIQSDTRIGRIYLMLGGVHLCPPQKNGAYFPHMTLIKPAGRLTDEELASLKAEIDFYKE